MKALDTVLGEFIKAVQAGFVTYLRQQGVDLRTVDIPAGSVILKRRTAEAWETGMRDAEEAAACRMEAVGMATLMASGTIAGIASAKELIGTV